jgi:hypothetical protein
MTTLVTVAAASVTALAPNASVTVTAAVNVIGGLPIGNYQLQAVVTPVQALVAPLTDANPANNTATLTAAAATRTIASVAAFVDIAGTLGATWTLPTTSVNGRPLTGNVSVIVSNLGNVALAVGQTVRVVFQAVNTVTSAITPLVTVATASVTALAPNGSVTVTAAVNLPTGLPLGSYQVQAAITPVLALVAPLTDANPANNTATLTAAAATRTVVSVAPFVDIAATLGATWTLPATGLAGRALAGNVSVAVTNLGNVALATGQLVNIQFVATDTLTGVATPLVTLLNRSVTALAVNASLTFIAAVSLPLGLTVGNYQIIAIVAPVQALVIADPNPTNNIGTLTAAGVAKTLSLVAPFVDLAGFLGTTWTLPTTRGAGLSLVGNVSATVTNLGNIALPVGQLVNITFLAHDTVTGVDTTLLILTNRSVTALAPNGSVTFVGAVNRPTGLLVGTYVIEASITVVQPLFESNLGNNLGVLTVAGVQRTLTVA